MSVVLRFGLDEPGARRLLQGSLVEVFETREGIPPAEVGKLRVSLKADVEPLQRALGRVISHTSGVQELVAEAQALGIVIGDGCTCGAPGGHPHEPDCGWWEVEAGRKAYERNLEELQIGDGTAWDQLPPATREHWIGLATDNREARAAYDRESAGYQNRTSWEELHPEVRQHWVDIVVEKREARRRALEPL